jgi:hypothetical protein
MTNTDIVRSIEQRLTEAKAEIARLEGARQALINGEAPAVTPRPRRAAGKSTPRTTVRASGGVVPAGKRTALLDGSVGMSTSELAKATMAGPARSSLCCASWRALTKSAAVESAAAPGGM